MFRVRKASDKAVIDDKQLKYYTEKPVSISNDAQENHVSSVEDLMTKSIVNLKTTNKVIFTEDDGEFVIPTGTKQLYISMCAGGGSGGAGETKRSLYFSGGGGGAGGGLLKVPVKIENDSEVKLVCRVGKGGNFRIRDGGDTNVDIVVNGNLHHTLRVTGGKGAVDNKGGAGGQGYTIYSGGNGRNGTITTLGQQAKGGDGGASLFSISGIGSSPTIQDKKRSYGKYGSGGAGGIPGELQTFQGGNGFVLIEYL